MSARKRKEETDRLNNQLRQINLQLRRQARVESYAPGLSYAPVSVVSGRALVADGDGLALVADPAPVNGVSNERADLLKRLKTGKKWLREQRPALALEEFKIALALARQAQDGVSEKKAARGLGEEDNTASAGPHSWKRFVPCRTKVFRNSYHQGS